MWHNLEYVAETRRFDPKEFVSFAEANKDKYGIVRGQVSTWHVDQLIKDFREVTSEPGQS